MNYQLVVDFITIISSVLLKQRFFLFINKREAISFYFPVRSTLQLLHGEGIGIVCVHNKDDSLPFTKKSIGKIQNNQIP